MHNITAIQTTFSLYNQCSRVALGMPPNTSHQSQLFTTLIHMVCLYYFIWYITTPLTSFTDGLIPSVPSMKSVGEIITDGLTDGTRPSVYQSSVTPISVAKSVANKKKHPPTKHRRSYRRIRARQKKKVSRGNITDGINPSAISTVSTDGLTDVYSVGNYGMAGNCLATPCEIPTDIIRRYIRRYVFKIYIKK